MNLNQYIIDDRIFTKQFSCDLVKCKGACCTLKGTLGAPVLENEIEAIDNAVPIVKKYLSSKNINVIESEDKYILDKGEIHLNTVKGNDCIFAFYEGDIAKCSIEKAYNNGELSFRKPISCFLYPIRISGKKRHILKYDYLYECNDALDKGKTENVSIFEFVKDAVVQAYGEEFYNGLKDKYIR